MYCSSCAGEAQVERVDHAGAEEPGVVQLEVLVAVAGHHREPVAALAGRAGACIASASRKHPVAVLPNVPW